MNVKKAIIETIMEVCDVEQELITDDIILVDDLGIDSLNILEVIIQLEEKFKVDFNVDEILLEYDINLKILTEYVEKLLK